MVDQITVFLENEEGHFAKLCGAISAAGINMSAVTIADTADYGLVRIVCNDPEACKQALRAAGYNAITTPVAAIGLPNEPGSLARLMAIFDELDVNVEYGYCFSAAGGRAVDVLKLAGGPATDEAIGQLEAAGFAVLSQEDLFA